MAANVPTSDTGTATLGTRAERRRRKNKPTTKVALGDVQRAVIIQTATIGEQTFAWWSDDDRFLVAIDGVGLGADACKAWFKEWFTIQPGQEINVHSLKQDAGETFVVQIRTK